MRVLNWKHQKEYSYMDIPTGKVHHQGIEELAIKKWRERYGAPTLLIGSGFRSEDAVNWEEKTATVRLRCQPEE